MEADLVTLLVVLVLAGGLAYKTSFFQGRFIGYFSVFQIVFLVVIPGFLFTLGYSYLQSILARPMGSQIFLSDSVLVNVILLSSLFTYGGLAIHAAAKTLARPGLLRFDSSKAGEMNRYFHLSFSHNLIYSGASLSVVGLTLLEMNHTPPSESSGFYTAVVKGLFLGLGAITTLYLYTKSDDDYSGRWADLKLAFLVFWVGFGFLLYSIGRIGGQLNEYQLLLPALFGLSLMAILNLILVFRRLKQGGWRVRVRWSKLKKLLMR